MVIFANPNVIVSVMVQIHIIILSYLVEINLIAFVLYGIDKKRAIRNEFTTHDFNMVLRIWRAKILWRKSIWVITPTLINDLKDFFKLTFLV